MAQFAFFHVGEDTTLPTILCRSLRANNLKAQIIQCSDNGTPAVEGVDEVVRFDGDTGNLMFFRTAAYSRLRFIAPTLFLDTDMICIDSVDPGHALNDGDAAVCLREYGRDMLLDPAAMGIDLKEYAGRTLGDVYPYIGCATICSNPEFWAACLEDMLRMPPKLHRWFGDQEALRNVVNQRQGKIRWLPESEYACLADVETDASKRPKFCHFKGPTRKRMMIDCAREIGLWT